MNHQAREVLGWVDPQVRDELIRINSTAGPAHYKIKKDFYVDVRNVRTIDVSPRQIEERLCYGFFPVPDPDQINPTLYIQAIISMQSEQERQAMVESHLKQQYCFPIWGLQKIYLLERHANGPRQLRMLCESYRFTLGDIIEEYASRNMVMPNELVNYIRGNLLKIYRALLVRIRNRGMGHCLSWREVSFDPRNVLFDHFYHVMVGHSFFGQEMPPLMRCKQNWEEIGAGMSLDLANTLRDLFSLTNQSRECEHDVSVWYLSQKRQKVNVVKEIEHLTGVIELFQVMELPNQHTIRELKQVEKFRGERRGSIAEFNEEQRRRELEEMTRRVKRSQKIQ